MFMDFFLGNIVGFFFIHSSLLMIWLFTRRYNGVIRPS